MTRAISIAASVLAVLALAFGVAQDDRFAFMPAGGAQLVGAVLEACSACGELTAWSAADRSADDWRAHLEEHGALEGLGEAEVATLTQYLATAFPTEAPVASVEDLPTDGRTLVIFQCQTCHSIATPMLEDRSVAAWLQHRMRPPHDGFDLDDEAWAHIASYLATNAPIPEDTIPAELRQGAGGY